MIAPVVRRVVDIAGQFQDAFVGLGKWFRADRPDGPTRPPGLASVSDC
jgi:hypothetical protein